MPSVTWLHLSDWHQKGARLELDRRVVLDALLRDLRKRSAIDPSLKSIDFVFFTGDLAFKGAKEEYGTFQTELLDRVCEAVEIGKDRLYLIPGNHDLDRSIVEGYLPPALQRPFRSKATAETWFESGLPRETLLLPFRAYQEFVSGYGCRGFGAFGGHERVTLANGATVGIVGCNSALMCGRVKTNGEVDDYGKLTVGEAQIYDHLRGIEEAQVRIALMHHPVAWLEGWDQGSVRQRLGQYSQFVLRGHEHSQAIQSLVGTDGDFVELAAGSSYDRRDSQGVYYNAYNFVRVDSGSGSGTAYLRRWMDRDNEWSFDSRRRHPEGVYSWGQPVQAPSPEPVAPPSIAREPAPVVVPTDVDIRSLPRRVAAAMSRAEVAGVWFSLFGTKMAEAVTSGSLQEDAIELISAANKRDQMRELLEDLARNHPGVFTK